MSSVLEIIKTRRSVRKYKADPVSRALIEKVIEAGTYAATGRGQQSPVIIAVTNGEFYKLNLVNPFDL
ncbi:MAG: nitroreductase family protein [Succinatimonas sp.]|nr:nitroreductase family protein [Succinatimonas sp.]